MGDCARLRTAGAASTMVVQQDSGQTAQQLIAAKNKIKVALAVVIAAKKKQVQRDGVDWKKKALAARQTLLALSKTLKSSGQASDDLQGTILHLLCDFKDVQLLQDQQQPQRTAVVQRSANLLSFIDATQVQRLLVAHCNRAGMRRQVQLGVAADCERDPGLEVRKTWAHLGLSLIHI